jgi:hypothetical protein
MAVTCCRVRPPAAVWRRDAIPSRDGLATHARKDFTWTEAVAIKREIEPEEKAAAKERQAAAGDRGKEGGRGKKKTLVANTHKGKPAPKARDKAAKATGKKALAKERQKRRPISSGNLPELKKARDGK